MTLQDRLQELIADRNHERAVTLAKAALQNEDVVRVAVEEDEVTVETERFRGVHRWWTDGDGRVVLDERGTYTCTCDEVDLSFSTMRMLPAAHERAVERIREHNAPDPEAATAGDPGAGGGHTPDATAGRSAASAERHSDGRGPTSGAGRGASTVAIPNPATAVADGGTPDEGGTSDGDGADGGETPGDAHSDGGRSRTASMYRTVRRFAGRFF